MVGNMNQMIGNAILSPEAKNAAMKVLVSPTEGWDSHVMRVIEIEMGGHTPKHQHPWPHINYVLEGEGTLLLNGEIHQVTSGAYAYIPAGALHQFKNVGSQIFKFICIVPKEGHKI